MEFIFIFAVILFEVFLIHFFEVVKIVGTFGIDTLMDDKVLSVFLGNQSVPAVGTTQFHRGEAAFLRGESCRADFTEKLSPGAIVFVQKGLGGVTTRAGAAVRNITI